MASFDDFVHSALGDEHKDRVTSVLDKDDYAEAQEETVASGALSVTTPVSLITVSGTVAYSLGDGDHQGQVKYIRVTAADTTPAGTLTPDNFADGTSITLDAAEEAVILRWGGSSWRAVNVNGATIS